MFVAITLGFTVGDQSINEDNGTVTLVVSVIPGSGTLQRSIDITYRTVALTSGNAATSKPVYTCDILSSSLHQNS